MRRVERSEIVDYQTYEDMREPFRKQVLAEKARRRIHLGRHFTLLFENPLTIRYQVQEMMRAEKIVREADIQHELDTYNALLGADGELAATLLIEIEDAQERAERLQDWIGLPGRLYAVFEDGSTVRALFDDEQRDSKRLSSVQYVRFPVSGRIPVALGIDLPGVETENRLTPEQRSALAADLRLG